MVEGIKNKEYLSGLTLRQLRQEASILSVPLYSRKTKAILIELILKYQKNLKDISTKTVFNKPPKTLADPIIQPSKEVINTKVVFLPRDPEWAYVFWQISECDREIAQSLGASKLCLRLFDATGVGEGQLNQGTLREINVDSYSTEWYLPIPLAAVSYTHLTLPTNREV